MSEGIPFPIDDVQCSWAPTVDARFEDGHITQLSLKGTLGKRARDAVIALAKLRVLDVSHVKGITNRWFAALAALPELKALSATYTCLGDSGAEPLAQSRSLEVLDVRHTKLGEAGIAALLSIPRLRHFQCGVGARVPSAGLAAIAAAENLEALAIVRPPFTYQSSWLSLSLLESISQLQQLRVLSLHGVVGDDFCAPGSELQQLSLASTWHRSGRNWLHMVESLTELQAIDLSYSNFESVSQLQVLTRLPKLRDATLYKTQLAKADSSLVRAPQIEFVATEDPAPSWIHQFAPNANLGTSVRNHVRLHAEGKVALP